MHTEVRREGPHAQGLCGSQITEIVKLVCGTRGYNERPVKRSEDEEEIDRVDQLKDIIMGKTEAFSYLQKRSDYQKKGIVCECCYNQCSILELQQYCNSSPGKRNYRLADRGDD
ncbi:hypothetical protein ScPMuIL_013095 [Solemya velum]